METYKVTDSFEGSIVYLETDNVSKAADMYKRKEDSMISVYSGDTLMGTLQQHIYFDSIYLQDRKLRKSHSLDSVYKFREYSVEELFWSCEESKISELKVSLHLNALGEPAIYLSKKQEKFLGLRK